MRNFKKLVALSAATVMALTMSVSAFAEVTASSSDSRFGDYADGAVTLASTDMINEDNQWTVVVISADKQNDTLTAEDLYYINQGTSGDTFWTDGMGTKTELEAGDYILRIGGETITSAEDLIEIPFTLTEKITETGKTIVFIWGDVNADDKADATDAGNILGKIVGGTATVGSSEYAIGETVVDDIIWGDVNADGKADATDAGNILGKIVGGTATAGTSEYAIGETVTLTVPQN
jgi:hypothetical protein